MKHEGSKKSALAVIQSHKLSNELTVPPIMENVIEIANTTKHRNGTSPRLKLLGYKSPVTLNSTACGVAVTPTTPTANNNSSTTTILIANCCCIDIEDQLERALVIPLLINAEYEMEIRIM